ncbi:hypothetical protein [Castellaniella sp. GW247-6E4]
MIDGLGFEHCRAWGGRDWGRQGKRPFALANGLDPESWLRGQDLNL